MKENNLAGLPKGRQVFSGVPFQVDGILELSGKKNIEWGRTEYPEAIKDIKLGKTAHQLHLLHGAGGVYDGDGTTIAKLVLHYADSSVREIEIKTGEHVRDWWGIRIKESLEQTQNWHGPELTLRLRNMGARTRGRFEYTKPRLRIRNPTCR